VDVERDYIHLEGGVLRFASPDELWIQVRVIGILPDLPLTNLVGGCESGGRVVLGAKSYLTKQYDSNAKSQSYTKQVFKDHV
jgi:hypothetical protein